MEAYNLFSCYDWRWLQFVIRAGYVINLIHVEIVEEFIVIVPSPTTTPGFLRKKCWLFL